MFEPGSDDDLIVRTVREFVERDVLPVAAEMERHDTYPEALVATMGRLGLFGLNVPEEYGGVDAGYTVFAAVFEELARAWLGLSGILATHLVLCDILKTFGTSDQQQRYLPVLARGEKRGALCLSEADAGSDLQSIRTTATRGRDVYRINGAKMWITNARHAQLFLVLTKTDTAVTPAHRGITHSWRKKADPASPWDATSRSWVIEGSRPARSCSTTSSFPRRTSSAGSRAAGSRS